MNKSKSLVLAMAVTALMLILGAGTGIQKLIEPSETITSAIFLGIFIAIVVFVKNIKNENDKDYSFIVAIAIVFFSVSIGFIGDSVASILGGIGDTSNDYYTISKFTIGMMILVYAIGRMNPKMKEKIAGT